MGGKILTNIKLNGTLELTEAKDGFWLYDETRGMNLAMRANTAQDAFVEALEYYQRRLNELERSYYSLHGKVETFVNSFTEDNED